MPRNNRSLLFDWGDTLMRDIPEFDGPMANWPRVEVIPYARETLRALRPSWTLCLATNAAASSEGEIWAALRRVGLDEMFDQVYCFHRIGYKKPAKEFFTYILNDLQLNAAQVIMVGDAFETDVRGPIEQAFGPYGSTNVPTNPVTGKCTTPFMIFEICRRL